MPDLLDGALDLRTGHRHRAPHLGDQDPAQTFGVVLQRGMQLRQAVMAEFEIARPIGAIEGTPGRFDRAGHIVDRAVHGLTDHLLIGRVNHVEHGAARRALKFTADQHPTVTGQHTGLRRRIAHRSSLLG